MLMLSVVSSNPRYCTIFGWSRSFNVSDSNFNAFTTVCCRESYLSLAVCGSSTCLTAIISPVVAFMARYTRPYVPFPISSPRTHLNVAVSVLKSHSDRGYYNLLPLDDAEVVELTLEDLAWCVVTSSNFPPQNLVFLFLEYISAKVESALDVLSILLFASSATYLIDFLLRILAHFSRSLSLS